VCEEDLILYRLKCLGLLYLLDERKRLLEEVDTVANSFGFREIFMFRPQKEVPSNAKATSTAFSSSNSR